MKPCFGYVRVSTLRQGEGVSLQAQKDAIEAFASQRNLTVTKWFEELRTAAKGGRPVFNQMLRDLKRGGASGVIIHKIDRAARNFRDWAMFSELPEIGIDIYFATETPDFTSRGGCLTANIPAVIAADYVRNLREETIKGLQGRLKQGLYPFRAPIGYLDNGRGKPKTPDPVKAPLIREMFELYASGQHSLRSLQAEMNRQGLRNRMGGRLSLCGVETVLENTFYAGLILIKSHGQSYRGVHEPIFPPSLFKRVQTLRTSRGSKRVTCHAHRLQGLFRCGLCSGPLSPERQKGRVYYRCQTRSCPTTSMREDALEEAVATNLKGLQISPRMARALERRWLAPDVPARLEERHASIDLSIAAETKRLERLTDLLIDGRIDDQTFRTRKASLELDLAELNEEKSRIPDAGQERAFRRDFLELMKSLYSLYVSGDRTTKREIVENAFSSRKVSGKNVDLEPHSWLRQDKSELSVLCGGPLRHTDRTSEVISTVGCAHLARLLAVGGCIGNGTHHPRLGE